MKVMEGLPRRVRLARSVRALVTGAALSVLGACAAPGPAPNVSPRAELGRNADYALVRPASGDSFDSLAAHYLGDPSRDWWLADVNGMRRDAQLDPRTALRVPLHAGALWDIDPSGQQVVPVLSYHRFDRSGERLAVAPEAFEAQLRYLRDHDYRVVTLDALERWLDGTEPLPRRAVVLTIDDGYNSVYEHAFPLLRQYDVPATLFVYTEFVGAGHGLEWGELRALRDSGLVSVQSHSHSHADLTTPEVRDRLDAETAGTRATLRRRLGGAAPSHFAYPYGAANADAVDAVRRAGFSLALTVRRGANPFYGDRLRLRRSMVFSDQGMDGFIASLETWAPLPARTR